MEFLEIMGVVWLTYKLRKVIFLLVVVGYISFLGYMSFGGGLVGSPFWVWGLFALLNGITVLVIGNIIEFNVEKSQLHK
nr:MAG TPA: hypothetical protein [Caudoviricetes sp.]